MTLELIIIGMLAAATLAFFLFVAHIGQESGKRARMLNEKHTEILDLKAALELAKQAAERHRLDAAASRETVIATNKEMAALREEADAAKAALKATPYVQAVRDLVKFAIDEQRMRGVFAIQDMERKSREVAIKYSLANKRLDLFRLFMDELIREGSSNFVAQTMVAQWEEPEHANFIIEVRTPSVCTRVIVREEELWRA